MSPLELNNLLSDIFVRYVRITDDEFQLRYSIFQTIFLKLRQEMKTIDEYYNRYSSNVQLVGSNFEGLKISHPDEFDIDIAIGLPLNVHANPDRNDSDIIIEPKVSGFAQLKMGKQFRNLPMRDGKDWTINQTAFQWGDENGYLLRTKFMYWFKSIVNKALNKFSKNPRGLPTCLVNGALYVINKSESGPAITLKIEDVSGKKMLDIDLVPVLKFPEDRWPVSKSYRSVPVACKRDHWLLVSKANKGAREPELSRTWRISLILQEKALLHDLKDMKMILRLVKKLRDVQNFDKIASYEIKTIFFWEIHTRNREFWTRSSKGELFTYMIKQFH